MRIGICQVDEERLKNPLRRKYYQTVQRFLEKKIKCGALDAGEPGDPRLACFSVFIISRRDVFIFQLSDKGVYI